MGDQLDNNYFGNNKPSPIGLAVVRTSLAAWADQAVSHLNLRGEEVPLGAEAHVTLPDGGKHD